MITSLVINIWFMFIWLFPWVYCTPVCMAWASQNSSRKTVQIIFGSEVGTQVCQRSWDQEEEYWKRENLWEETPNLHVNNPQILDWPSNCALMGVILRSSVKASTRNLWNLSRDFHGGPAAAADIGFGIWVPPS